jgi:hypothetical protein
MVKLQYYLLEWLDMLISVTLNPEKTDISTIRTDQFQYVLNNLNIERDNFKKCMMSHVFSGNDAGQIKTLICQYHDTLIILLDQTLRNQTFITSRESEINNVINSIIAVLDELLTFMETRFSKYLSLIERAPTTYAIVSGKELGNRLRKLKGRLGGQVSSTSKIEIVLKRIGHFSTTICQQREVTFKDVLYQKELLNGLEDVVTKDLSDEIYSPLDNLLIYLNFNSKAYINRLSEQLAAKINAGNSTSEKMEILLVYFKAFNQLHKKPEVVLNVNYHDLTTIMDNWFSQEMLYLEKKLHLSVIPLQGEAESPIAKEEMPKPKQKVLCIMSTDQMGLILRAADELRVLVAKSMSEVFKTIVPHLSTPYKDDLSYDGMRSKSYVAEERDKQIVIETLERIIKKIKEY